MGSRVFKVVKERVTRKIVEDIVADAVEHMIKSVPKKIVSKVKSEMTMELTITSRDDSYHDFMAWIDREYGSAQFRNLCATKQYDIDYIDGEVLGKTMTVMGYGTHKIKYKGVSLTLSLESQGDGNNQYDVIRLTKLGKDRKLFDKLISELAIENEDSNTIRLYKFDDSRWGYVRDIPKRKPETVFLDKDEKEKMLGRIIEFTEKEQWYLDNGVPYQLGIMLHGEAGTGKTSTVRVIASELDYPLYYLPTVCISQIQKAVLNLPDKCVLVIEDIDTSSITHSRDGEDAKKSQKIEGDDLSSLLNSLDGILASHGRVLVATTNHIQKLDKALLRHGRFDLKVNISYVTKHILKSFLDRFFPDEHICLECINIKENVVVATLQNMIMEDKTCQEIVTFMTADIDYDKIGLNK